MTFKRGDIVLAAFPFAEKRVSKRRPALVISSDAYNSVCPDVVVAQITSRTGAPPRPGDYRVHDWQTAGLRAPSLVRARLATLHSSVVVKRLGAMPEAEMAGVSNGLRSALGLEHANA